jgi:hypothetical protein
MTTWHIPQGQVSNNLLRHGGRLGTSDEDWGPIYGPQCFLTSKMMDLLSELHLSFEACQIRPVDFLRHLIAVGGDRHRVGKVEVRCDCKRLIEVRDFRYVVGHGQ